MGCKTTIIYFIQVNRFVILLTCILFCVNLFAQTNLPENTEGTVQNPFLFVEPNGNTGFNDVLDYLLSNPKVEIIENDGQNIQFLYDGGLDWLTGNEEGSYMTKVSFFNNQIKSMLINVTQNVHLLERAKHSVTFITNHTRIAPKIEHRSYKPKGAEYYCYQWNLENCIIRIRIDDWSNDWYSRMFRIGIDKK